MVTHKHTQTLENGWKPQRDKNISSRPTLCPVPSETQRGVKWAEGKSTQSLSESIPILRRRSVRSEVSALTTHRRQPCSWCGSGGRHLKPDWVEVSGEAIWTRSLSGGQVSVLVSQGQRSADNLTCGGFPPWVPSESTSFPFSFPFPELAANANGQGHRKTKLPSLSLISAGCSFAIWATLYQILSLVKDKQGYGLIHAG